MMAKEIALNRLKDAVDEVGADSIKPSQWARLRPSELAHECSRYLYNSFRWVSELQPMPGRVARIMARGQREEDQIVSDLKAAGLEISEKDESTGKQWSVSLLGGHSFGYLDGAGFDPHQIQIDTGKWFVLEVKTHNKKNFDKLKKDGVQKGFPKHFGQMQIYMHETGMGGALYAARCKDDEEDFFRFVTYDKSYATRLIQKGHRIIFVDDPPEKITLDPNLYVCRYCIHKEVCHGERMPLRNCRTCLHSAPVDGGKWWCRKHGRELSRSDQRAGCEGHRWIPGMLNGELIHRDGDAFLRYRVAGKVITDGGPS